MPRTRACGAHFSESNLRRCQNKRDSESVTQQDQDADALTRPSAACNWRGKSHRSSFAANFFSSHVQLASGGVRLPAEQRSQQERSLSVAQGRLPSVTRQSPIQTAAHTDRRNVHRQLPQNAAVPGCSQQVLSRNSAAS